VRLATILLMSALGCQAAGYSVPTPDAEAVQATATVPDVLPVPPDVLVVTSGQDAGQASAPDAKVSTPDTMPATAPDASPDAQMVPSADGGNVTIGWTYTDLGLGSPDAGQVKVVTDAGIRWLGYSDQWTLVLPPLEIPWRWCNANGWCIDSTVADVVPTCALSPCFDKVLTTWVDTTEVCIPQLEAPASYCQPPTPALLDQCLPMSGVKHCN